MNPSNIGLPSKFTEFRRDVKQLDIIANLVASDKRFTILSAPPGIGKSVIGVATSRILSGRLLYLTITKTLQTQLHNDFSEIGMVNIVGHSNYPCASTMYDDSGEMSDMECAARRGGYIDGCRYQQKVNECLSTSLVVSNPAHWTQLYKSEDPDRLGDFDILIIDEAHNIHDKLVDYVSVKINRSVYSKYLHLSCPSSSPNNESDISVWLSWAIEARNAARVIYRKVKSDDNSGSIDYKLLATITRLGSDLSRFIEGVEGYKSGKPGYSEWLACPVAGNVTLSPVWAGRFAEQYLFRGIKRVLLVSATINRDTAKHLSIPGDNFDYIEVDSAFPIRRRPFIYLPTCKVDFRMTDAAKKQLISRIDTIASTRLHTKGIVHTGSYDRVEMYTGLTRYSDFVITHGRGSNAAEKAIFQFKREDPPAILCSPSIEEGHDFADDLCRWQIPLKVPLPDKRDRLTKARIDSDPSFEMYLTVDRLEQCYGRICRSKKDWGETFMLDKHWGWFRKKAKFHKWFKAAWVDLDSIPAPLQVKNHS